MPRKTAPDTGTTSYGYDAAGNLISRTDANSQTVTQTYDALNRLVSQSYPGAARDILFGYDQPTIGRLTSIQEEESDRSFHYDSLGRLDEETSTRGSAIATTRYGYDATSGELAAITYPSGRVLGFSRDATGRVSGLTLDGTPLARDIGYLPFGPMQNATLGSLSLTRTYDLRYQLSRIQVGSLDYIYTRDDAGRITQIDNTPAITLQPGTVNATYSENNNQATSLSGAINAQFTYDAAGNMRTDGSLTYTWDALNRLVQVEESGAVIATYGYDAQNRRIRKTAGGRTIHYHYDMFNQLIAETLADGTPLRDYFFLNGEPLALKEYETNPGLYYFLNDHLGTPQQLVTSSGAVVWQAAYLPYGVAQIKTATITNNLRFPGQYFDAETGLHYNWNRFYDPTTGRYISADPIGLAGGINLYAYVGGDPVNKIDPLGLADNWYGYNDKNFRDWVHGIKQDEGRPGSHNYTKDEIKDLYKQWEGEGNPRGKGGTSGKGGSYRGFKGRCVGILGLIGITLDAIEAQMLYEECKKDPCACNPDDCT